MLAPRLPRSTLRGAWRLWVVAAVAWSAYLVWQSDVACPLLLLGIQPSSKPWCDYQNAEPIIYYGWLLMKMVVGSLVAALIIAAGVWIFAGFRSGTAGEN